MTSITGDPTTSAPESTEPVAQPLRWATWSSFTRNNRWLFERLPVLIVIGLLFSRYATEVGLRAFEEHSPYRALFAPMAGAIFVAVWLQLCQPPGLDIHDRQVDGIAAVGLIIVGASLTDLLGPRLRDLEGAARLDLIALPIYLMAVGCAIFGTRPTFRQWRTFTVLFFIWPVPFDMTSRWISTSNFGFWILDVSLVVTLCAILAVSFRRRLFCALVSGIGAFITVSQASTLGGPISLGVTVVLFAAVTKVTRCHLMRPKRRLRDVPTARTRLPTVKSARASSLAITALMGVIAFIPAGRINLTTQTASTTVPAVDALTCPSLPRWTLTSQLAPRLQRFMGQLPERECFYDSPSGIKGRPIRAEVSLTGAEPLITLAQFPWEATHQVLGTEAPGTNSLNLGPRTTGYLLIYSDPTHPLTTIVITWDWLVPGEDHNYAQRISVAVTDDPLATSPFPTSTYDVGRSLVRRMIEVLHTNLTYSALYAVTSKNLPITKKLAHLVVTAANR